MRGLPPPAHLIWKLVNKLVEKKTKLQKYSAPALEKGLDILEFLSVTDTKPTLSQLAAGIGRSKSEIFRMMIVLEERGYICRIDGDLFILTDKLKQISGNKSGVNRLVEMTSPTLDILAQETGLSNHLSVLQDDVLVVVRSTPVMQNYGLSVQVGYESPLFGTSAGACFFSDLPMLDSRRSLLERLGHGLEEDGFRTFDDLVVQCRSDGFVVAPNPDVSSIFELSAPIRHQATEQTLAALTLPFVRPDKMSNQMTAIQQCVKNAVGQIQERVSLALTHPSLQTVGDL